MGDITSINFRLDAVFPGPFGPFNLPNVQIDMSITPVAPENPSLTFADNLGPAVNTVYQGDIIINLPQCTVNPCPFDMMIPLEVPFPYNPSEGNLIVDFRVPNCIDFSVFAFDSDDSIPTTVMNRVFTTVPDGVDDPTGVSDGDIGLVTQFVIVPQINVPTLSEWGLIAMAGALGIVGFVVIRRKSATA